MANDITKTIEQAKFLAKILGSEPKASSPRETMGENGVGLIMSALPFMRSEDAKAVFAAVKIIEFRNLVLSPPKQIFAADEGSRNIK